MDLLVGANPALAASIVAGQKVDSALLCRVIRSDRSVILVGHHSSGQTYSLPRRLFGGIEQDVVTGDWLWYYRDTECVEIVARQTLLARKRSGSGVQPIAANIDTVFIAVPMDRPLRLTLIERMTILAWDSGATPHLVLTKCDLVSEDTLAHARYEISTSSFGIDTSEVSLQDSSGLARLVAVLASPQSAVFIGQSGAGKSTLINRLLGKSVRDTAPVREKDARGRHRTSASEIIPVPGTPSVVIDTAGVRQVSVDMSGDGVHEVFADLIELSSSCRFYDCAHDGDAGCAIAASVEREEIDCERVARYLKLLRDEDRTAKKSTPERRNKSVEYTRFAREYRARRGH